MPHSLTYIINHFTHSITHSLENYHSKNHSKTLCEFGLSEVAMGSKRRMTGAPASPRPPPKFVDPTLVRAPDPDTLPRLAACNQELNNRPDPLAHRLRHAALFAGTACATVLLSSKVQHYGTPPVKAPATMEVHVILWIIRYMIWNAGGRLTDLWLDQQPMTDGECHALNAFNVFLCGWFFRFAFDVTHPLGGGGTISGFTLWSVKMFMLFGMQFSLETFHHVHECVVLLFSPGNVPPTGWLHRACRVLAMVSQVSVQCLIFRHHWRQDEFAAAFIESFSGLVTLGFHRLAWSEFNYP